MAQTKSAHIRGRISENEPNPLDVYFGQRMKLRREMLGLSQLKLSRQLGITFQQVQKYEKGVNRVGFSRACDIADLLGTTLDYFREGIDTKSLNQSPMRLVNDSAPISFKYLDIDIVDPLKSTETLELVKNYYKIKNRKLASNIFTMLQVIANSNSMLPGNTKKINEIHKQTNFLINKKS